MRATAADLQNTFASLVGATADGPVTATLIDSPVGPLVAAATDAGLAMLEFSDEKRITPQARALTRHLGPTRIGGHRHIDQTAAELAEYFAGARRAFEVPLVIKGTPFQEAVWAALLDIPYRPLANGGFNHASRVVLVDRSGTIIAHSDRFGVPDPAFIRVIRGVLSAPAPK